jgi:hypothetical protein
MAQKYIDGTSARKLDNNNGGGYSWNPKVIEGGKPIEPDETPDYSGSKDYSKPRDYSNPTAEALHKAEKAAANNGKPGSRDIGKQERETKEPAWKTNMEAKRQAAMAASKDKNKATSFFARQ